MMKKTIKAVKKCNYSISKGISKSESNLTQLLFNKNTEMKFWNMNDLMIQQKKTISLSNDSGK